MAAQNQCLQRVGNQAILSRLSSGLNQLRQQESFCDVVILVGDQRFPAHKAVLSSTSDYFQRMFSSGFKESTMDDITIPGTGESFAQILECAYTGNFMVSIETVADILNMAGYMLFTEVIEGCAEFIMGVKDQLPLQSCFEIWLAARDHPDMTNITKLCQSHLLQNFNMCVKLKPFLQNVSAGAMSELLSDEEIETDAVEEEDILQAVLRWLNFNWEQRMVHAVNLLQNLRLGLIPTDQLIKILGDELMAKPEIKSMMEEVKKLQTINVNTVSVTPSLIKNHSRLFASRNTISAYTRRILEGDPYKVFTLGCVTDSACYRFARLPDLPHEFPFHTDNDFFGMSTCVADGHLYVGGILKPDTYHTLVEQDGREDSHWNWVKQNNLFRYDAEKNEWIVLHPMPLPMDTYKIIPLFGYLYFIGKTYGEGYYERDVERDPTFSIFRYDIHHDSWTYEGDLPFERIHILEISECILIAGESREITQFMVYKTAERKLVDVTVNNAAYYLGSGSTLDFVKSEDSVFYITKGTRYSEEDFDYQYTKSTKNNAFRVDFDFDYDKPSMIISDVGQDPNSIVIQPYLEKYKIFTFDKRKVGMEKIDCDCTVHAHRATLAQMFVNGWHFGI